MAERYGVSKGGCIVIENKDVRLGSIEQVEIWMDIIASNVFLRIRITIIVQSDKIVVQNLVCVDCSVFINIVNNKIPIFVEISVVAESCPYSVAC